MRTYRASSLGYSLEALVAPHLGYEAVAPPDYLQKAFDEGHRLEPLIIDKLRDMGWMIQTEQEEVNAVGDNQIEVELEVIPGVAKVVGHLDGILTHIAGDSMVLEVKTMAGKSWQQFKQHGWDTPGIIQKYKWQASAYSLATGLAHYMVAFNKETEELHIVDSYEPFYSISDIALKLQAAEDAITAGIIPEGCTDFPCPYFYLHPPKDTPEPVDSQLEAIIAAWLEADRAMKVHEGEKKVLREQIIEMLGEQENLAPVIKASNGVTITTSWQQPSEYVTKRKGTWVTKIQGPRSRGNHVAE